MSTIKHTDKILSYFDSGSKMAISQDMIISAVFEQWFTASPGSVYRINSLHQVIWLRQLFTQPYPAAAGGGYGRQCRLSHDGQFLYVVGLGPTPDNFGIAHFYKLNAATGATEWARETVDHSTKLCVDHNGDIIIWRDEFGYLMKYDADGNTVWGAAIQYDYVSDIAVDSDNNIYLAHGNNVSGYSLQKLGPDGVALSVGYTIPNAYNPGTGALAVKIDKNDNIFVGSVPSEQPDTYYHALFKLDTDCNFVASARTGPDDGNTHSCRNVVIDSLGNVIALGSRGHLYKYSNALVEQWPPVRDGTSGSPSIQILCDVHNRIHQIHVPISSTTIRDKDGTFVSETTMPGLPVRSILFAREVYMGLYTDQPTILFREDMTPFMNDAIPEWVGGDNTRLVGDLVWADDVGNIRSEQGTGIFENLHAGEDVIIPGVAIAWKQLGWVPSADPPNANWDTYPPYDGGIGKCPQIYTVTFFGMKNISDGLPSEFNGEYLLIRGPGLYGFFVGVDHDAGIRINFTVRDELDNKEKLHLGTDEYPSSIFKYETVTNNNEKLTHVANQNPFGGLPPDYTVYDGYGSMYPGKRERWDAITVWAVDSIVAWQAWFYKALNQNSGSEPPSGDWDRLV